MWLLQMVELLTLCVLLIALLAASGARFYAKWRVSESALLCEDSAAHVDPITAHGVARYRSGSIVSA